MDAKSKQSKVVTTGTHGTAQASVRLHYLDWLRVFATLGVFLFHSSNVFNGTGFEVANAESSIAILIVDMIFYPWGMPLFFLLAGAGSWFALRRRSAGQFTRERTLRLLVPFFTGTLLLGPVQLFLSWSHRTQTGVWDGSFLEFVGERLSYPFPKIFGGMGYHMWFLGFLFAYSLLALPLFLWLKGETGRKVVARLAGLCERRGGLLLFALPPAVARLALHPFFPELQHWSDFFFFGTFFVLGYLIFSDERFSSAIRRDWRILLGAGVAALVAAMATIMMQESFDVEKSPSTVLEFLTWASISVCGWCATAFLLFVGMRWLDRDSQALRYGQTALLPFFVVHQPAILAIAYFVVQWDLGILPKLLVLVVSAFAVSLGLYQLVIRRVGFLRAMFGVKAERPVAQTVPAVQVPETVQV